MTRAELANEAWQAARRFVIERDRGLCQRCGAAGSDVMHLLGKGAHPWIRYEPTNLALGCRFCHGWLDQHPHTRAAWVAEKYGPLRLAELHDLDRRGERDGRAVDLVAVIRGFRERDLTDAEMRAYASGAWLSSK